MEAILKALRKIKRPGTFVTSGVIEPCFIGLEITDVGTVGLPLSENQAQTIIEHCYQAPYGHGEETILDTDVRRTWQMEPQNIHIHNPQWQIVMRDLVAQIAKQLGLGECRVSHHLYKLLIYETGDFFTSHRDTEKVNNMFGTLLIALPSEHEGGELFVRHTGLEEMIYFGGKNKHYQIQYAAFYADCKHEVKPISRGYRCCLVYNLALEDTQQQPMAPDNSTHVEQLGKLFKKHFKQKVSQKMVILLEHQYTKAGLSFDNLKNADRMKADVLLQAAKQAECEAYLTMLTLWESGNAEGYYDNYYGNEDDYEMGEVYDSSLSVDYWIASDGTKKPFGEINIGEDEIVSEISLKELETTEQEIHEASGNEGVSMERWYHQAALVIWSKQQHFYQLCQAGQHHAIPQLSEMVRDLATSAQTTDTDSWQQCQQFATEIINTWNTADHYSATEEDYADSQIMLELLITISDVELLQKFMKTILTQTLSGKEGKTIVKVCKQHGWLTFQEELVLMAKQDKNALAFMSLFEQLCLFEEETERLTVCKVLAPKVFAAIKAHDDNLKQNSYWYSTERDDKVNPVESLLKSLYYIDEMKILIQAVTYFSHDGTHYPLHTKLIPAVKNLAPWFARQTHSCIPFQELSKHCIDELKKRTKARVITPKDWKQDITLSCTCADCQELQQFLKVPTEQVHRFRVRKDRRQHLHQQIDSHKCDMTHQTERKGSPHTLVCTKNYSSYEKRQKQWEVDKKLLKELQRM